MSKLDTWRKLTRDDLRGWLDDDQTKLVLYAMEAGGVGRVSRNGHIILRNDRGQTMSVGRNGHKRTKQNTAAELVRLFGAPVEKAQARAEARAARPRSQGSLALAPEPDADETLMPCPAHKCEATFVTEGARYAHIAAKHPYKCPVEGCGFACDTPQGISMHRRIVHEGWRPGGKDGARAKRRKQKAPAPAADVNTPAPEPAPADAPPAAQADPDPAAGGASTGDADMVRRMRELLGADPRIAELEARVEELTRERDDARTQLALVREALHLQ